MSNITPIRPKARGGSRPGAGRPTSPSHRIRVPEQHLPAVVSLLDHLKTQETDSIEELGTLVDKTFMPLPFVDGTVPCGFANPTDDYAEEPLDLNTIVADPNHREATFIVRARGDSMWPIIQDGAELVVDRALTPKNGSIVVAVYQQKATCKRLYFKGDGTPYLKAENPHYEDKIFSEGDEFEVWGVVRYVLNKVL